MPQKVNIDAKLEHIAQVELGISTLQNRHSDRLDFHDVGVGCVKAALQAAYDAGHTAGRLHEIDITRNA